MTSTLNRLLRFAASPKITINKVVNNAIDTHSERLSPYYNCRYFSMEKSLPGPVQVVIEKKLKEGFNPTFLEVVNESYKHSVPQGSESHFKVVIVSDSFQGKTPLQRHRGINKLLSDELANKIHALSIQAKTPAQWDTSGQQIANTPPCLGGSKADQK